MWLSLHISAPTADSSCFLLQALQNTGDACSCGTKVLCLSVFRRMSQGVHPGGRVAAMSLIPQMLCACDFMNLLQRLPMQCSQLQWLQAHCLGVDGQRYLDRSATGADSC